MSCELPDGDPGGDSFRRLWAFARRAGISRLADLTGLDRLGLPAIQAIRPAALSEVTGLGRGPNLTAAATGAIMESLERYFAERIPPERLLTAPADDLHTPPGWFEAMVRPGGPGGWRGIPLPWIEGSEVVSGRAQHVPFELVHTLYTEPPPPGDGIFARSTTGLACHTNLQDAVLHGLFECIERDAIARAFATHGFFERHRIDHTCLTGYPAGDLLAIAQEAGLSVALWHAPSPTGFPVIWCQVIETAPQQLLILPTEGFAARADASSAAFTALLEALVTRAAAISGTRDDQTRAHYGITRDSPAARRARELVLDTPMTVRADAGEDTPELTTSEIIERAAQSELGPVLSVSVGRDASTGVECVRVILPRAHPLTIVR